MEETSHISPLRRWLESILVWYILFMIVFLLERFVIRTEWRFIALLNNGAPYLFLPVIVGLVITLLLRSRRLIGIYFIATVVGLTWLIPPLIPSLPDVDTSSGTQVEIISFNLYPENTDLSEAVVWLSSYAPDLLALQELPEDTSELNELESLYPYQAVQGQPTGSAFYSVYPIVDAQDVNLNTNPDDGEWNVQRLVLDINGQVTVVYNIHLTMPLNDQTTNWTILRYDESRRNAQINRLLALVGAETDPVILVGDFNMTEWSSIYHDIANQLDDAYRNTSWGVGATWPAGEPEELLDSYPRLFRIDYVWYTDPIKAVYSVVGANIGSDHLPLRVELLIP